MIKQTTAPKWRKTNRRTTYSRGIAYQGWANTNKQSKQTNKIAYTWCASLQATSYSSHHHQTMHKTRSKPKKKKKFKRRRKSLLELHCFLSVDWYKYHKATKSPTDACTVENGTPYVYMIVKTCIYFGGSKCTSFTLPPPPLLRLSLLDWWCECRNYLPGWKRKWTMVKRVNKGLGQGGTSVKNQVSVTINTWCEKWGDVKRGAKVHDLSIPGKGLHCVRPHGFCQVRDSPIRDSMGSC